MSRKPYGVLIAAIFAILLLLFLQAVAEILLLFFIAVLFGLYLGAITDALEVHFALPRFLGVLTAILLTALGLVAIGYLLIPPLAEQTQELIRTLPAQLVAWENRLLALAERSPIAARLLGPLQRGESYVGTIIQEIGGYVSGIVPYVFSGLQFLIDGVSILVMGVFLVARPGLYRRGLVELTPPVHRELVRDLLRDLGSTLRSWIVGQLLAMTILGALTWIGLLLLDVPYALAFGVFTGAAAIVPFFGALFSTLLPAIVVLGTAGVVKALAVVALGLVIQLIESNFVTPIIFQHQVHLPPVLTLLSILIMAQLLGLIGVLVAVPTLAAAMVIVKRIYVDRILEGKGFRRFVRDEPLEVRLPTGDGDVLVHPDSDKVSVPAMLE